MLKNNVFILCLLCVLTVTPVHAQSDLQAYEARLALADQMLAINPPRDQVENAVNVYIEKKMRHASELERTEFRIAMLKIINYRALEKLSREAYAELFTQAELEAMVEYYSKPEAISVRAKTKTLHARIYPEIIRMMDQALIRAKTSANP